MNDSLGTSGFMNTENIRTFLMFLEASGTLLVAFLAIFGWRVRSWFFRPIIKIKVDSNEPFVVDVPQFNSKDSEVESKHIRLKIYNSGKETVKHCRVGGNLIFKRRASGDFFKFKEFIPAYFLWTSDRNSEYIDPYNPAYLLMAKLEEPQRLIDSRAGDIAYRSPSLNLDGPPVSLMLMLETCENKGEFISLGNGDFIIPITILANNLKRPKRYFIEILWNGRKIDDIREENFYIEVLAEKKARQILGELYDSVS